MSKEEVARRVKQGDRVFCVVEVPIIVSRSEVWRYEEVYDWVRRRNTRP